MIKRDENKENLILRKLSNDVPEFLKLEELDNLIYVDYDRLGTYILKLIDNFDNNNKFILSKIFSHLNSIFDRNDELILNVLEVCIYEAIVTNKYGYMIAERFMHDEMYKHFIENFPYEKHKDSWNTSNYYSDEEYQQILNLLKNDDVD